MHIKLQYEMAAAKFLRLFNTPKYLERIAWTTHWALRPLRSWAKHQMVSHLSLAYQMATAYLRAQQEVRLFDQWRAARDWRRPEARGGGGGAGRGGNEQASTVSPPAPAIQCPLPLL